MAALMAALMAAAEGGPAMELVDRSSFTHLHVFFYGHASDSNIGTLCLPTRFV